jgi:hypothetical protein
MFSPPSRLQALKLGRRLYYPSSLNDLVLTLAEVMKAARKVMLAQLVIMEVMLRVLGAFEAYHFS